MRHSATALAIVTLSILALECGAGKEDTTASKAPSTTAEQEPLTPQSTPSTKQETPAPRPGSKRAAPGVPVSKEGDNSIQTYGVEAGNAERAEITDLVQSFLDARAAGNWARACSLLAAKPRAEQLAFGARSCAQGMAFFAKDAYPEILKDEAEVEVLSLRADSRNAFLIYRRHSGVWATALEREAGSWKVISVTAAPVG